MKKTNSTKKGKQAEHFACEFLKKHDFSIIATNFYTRFGEIDIIASKNGILHFIEVKSGKNFEPSYNIHAKKLDHLQKSIQIYLTKEPNSSYSSYCLDAMILYELDEGYGVHFLENITLF